MRALFIALALAACSQPQEQVELDHPSPEPSSFTVERACPDPDTEFDTEVTAEGHIYARCKPRES